jgi:hypothetical protein
VSNGTGLILNQQRKYWKQANHTSSQVESHPENDLQRRHEWVDANNNTMSDGSQGVGAKFRLTGELTERTSLKTTRTVPIFH